MSAPIAISEKNLNEKIMGLLCARPSCADARSVSLELVADPTLDYNWLIGHFDPGRGDRYTCKVTLRSIHESLRSEYHMVGQS